MLLDFKYKMKGIYGKFLTKEELSKIPLDPDNLSYDYWKHLARHSFVANVPTTGNFDISAAIYEPRAGGVPDVWDELIDLHVRPLVFEEMISFHIQYPKINPELGLNELGTFSTHDTGLLGNNFYTLGQTHKKTKKKKLFWKGIKDRFMSHDRVLVTPKN